MLYREILFCFPNKKWAHNPDKLVSVAPTIYSALGVSNQNKIVYTEPGKTATFTTILLDNRVLVKEEIYRNNTGKQPDFIITSKETLTYWSHSLTEKQIELPSSDEDYAFRLDEDSLSFVEISLPTKSWSYINEGYGYLTKTQRLPTIKGQYQQTYDAVLINTPNMFNVNNLVNDVSNSFVETSPYNYTNAYPFIDWDSWDFSENPITKPETSKNKTKNGE